MDPVFQRLGDVTIQRLDKPRDEKAGPEDSEPPSDDSQGLKRNFEHVPGPSNKRTKFEFDPLKKPDSSPPHSFSSPELSDYDTESEFESDDDGVVSKASRVTEAPEIVSELDASADFLDKLVDDPYRTDDPEDGKSESDEVKRAVQEDDYEYDIKEKLKEMGEISFETVKKGEKPKKSDGASENEVIVTPAKKTSAEEEMNDRKTAIGNLRRNIREVMDETKLDESTLAAQRQEMERLRRVQEQQRMLRDYQRQIQQERVISLLQGNGSAAPRASSSSGAPGAGARIGSTVLVKLPNGQTMTKVIKKPFELVKVPKSAVPPHKNPKSLIAIKKPPPGNLTPSVSIAPVVKRPLSVESRFSDTDSDSEDAMSMQIPIPKPKPKDPVTTIDISSDDDCIVVSESENDPNDDTDEDPSNSGLHTNDEFNQPDESGRVVVNVGHADDEADVYLAPQIARIIKPHQIGGVRFLFDNVIESVNRFESSTGFGCILAHSMGLGKTLQIVCFSDVFLRHTPARTILCIMPINTLQNWMAEYNMWLPTEEAAGNSPLNAHGEVRPRTFNLHVLNDSHKTLAARARVIHEWTTGGGVLLIGYEQYRLLSLRKHPKSRKKAQIVEPVDDDKSKLLFDEVHEALVKPGPDLVICDEGHRIKNSHASISQALKQMRTKRRVVLTGYPLQNNLMEYWCMVDFVRPNYLGTKTEFCNMFERPIQNGQCIDSTEADIKLMRYRAHVLHSLLLGFVQRRSHTVLQTALPQKEEYVLLVRMTPFQRTLYETFMNEVVRTQTVPNPLKAFAVCCKIWNHPDVLYYFLKKQAGGETVDIDLEEVATSTTNETTSKPKKGSKKSTSKGKNAKPAASVTPYNSSGDTTSKKKNSSKNQNNVPHGTVSQPSTPIDANQNYPNPNYPVKMEFEYSNSSGYATNQTYSSSTFSQNQAFGESPSYPYSNQSTPQPPYPTSRTPHSDVSTYSYQQANSGHHYPSDSQTYQGHQVDQKDSFHNKGNDYPQSYNSTHQSPISNQYAHGNSNQPNAANNYGQGSHSYSKGGYAQHQNYPSTQQGPFPPPQSGYQQSDQDGNRRQENFSHPQSAAFPNTPSTPGYGGTSPYHNTTTGYGSQAGHSDYNNPNVIKQEINKSGYPGHSGRPGAYPETQGHSQQHTNVPSQQSTPTKPQQQSETTASQNLSYVYPPNPPAGCTPNPHNTPTQTQGVASQRPYQQPQGGQYHATQSPYHQPPVVTDPPSKPGYHQQSHGPPEQQSKSGYHQQPLVQTEQQSKQGYQQLPHGPPEQQLKYGYHQQPHGSHPTGHHQQPYGGPQQPSAQSQIQNQQLPGAPQQKQQQPHGTSQQQGPYHQTQQQLQGTPQQQGHQQQPHGTSQQQPPYGHHLQSQNPHQQHHGYQQQPYEVPQNQGHQPHGTPQHTGHQQQLHNQSYQQQSHGTSQQQTHGTSQQQTHGTPQNQGHQSQTHETPQHQGQDASQQGFQHQSLVPLQQQQVHVQPQHQGHQQQQTHHQPHGPSHQQSPHGHSQQSLHGDHHQLYNPSQQQSQHGSNQQGVGNQQPQQQPPQHEYYYQQEQHNPPQQGSNKQYDSHLGGASHLSNSGYSQNVPHNASHNVQSHPQSAPSHPPSVMPSQNTPHIHSSANMYQHQDNSRMGNGPNSAYSSQHAQNPQYPHNVDGYHQNVGPLMSSGNRSQTIGQSPALERLPQNISGHPQNLSHPQTTGRQQHSNNSQQPPGQTSNINKAPNTDRHQTPIHHASQHGHSIPQNTGAGSNANIQTSKIHAIPQRTGSPHNNSRDQNSDVVGRPPALANQPHGTAAPPPQSINGQQQNHPNMGYNYQNAVAASSNVLGSPPNVSHNTGNQPQYGNSQHATGLQHNVSGQTSNINSQRHSNVHAQNYGSQHPIEHVQNIDSRGHPNPAGGGNSPPKQHGTNFGHQQSSSYPQNAAQNSAHPPNPSPKGHKSPQNTNPSPNVAVPPSGSYQNYSQQPPQGYPASHYNTALNAGHSDNQNYPRGPEQGAYPHAQNQPSYQPSNSQGYQHQPNAYPGEYKGNQYSDNQYHGSSGQGVSTGSSPKGFHSNSTQINQPNHEYPPQQNTQYQQSQHASYSNQQSSGSNNATNPSSAYQPNQYPANYQSSSNTSNLPGNPGDYPNTMNYNQSTPVQNSGAKDNKGTSYPNPNQQSSQYQPAAVGIDNYQNQQQPPYWNQDNYNFKPPFNQNYPNQPQPWKSEDGNKLSPAANVCPSPIKGENCCDTKPKINIISDIKLSGNSAYDMKKINILSDIKLETKSENEDVKEESKSDVKAETKQEPSDDDIKIVEATPAVKVAAKEDTGIPYDWAIELLKDYMPGIIENSAKMEILFCIIKESIALGDRLLVFSQSLITLDLIEQFLQMNVVPGDTQNWAKNCNYYRLDGSTSALEREKLINEFNSNPKIYLFLVSTRAGSLGINLIGANRVVVLDASWNPCHDTQAVCRVYRYGQRKPCFVYRLVVDNCLEKKIYDRQINKQGMSDRVVDECNPDAHLTMKDVSTLCWDDKTEEGEEKDWSHCKDNYIDVVLQKVLVQYGKRLNKEPFQHESLLVDRKDKQLSQQEKRLAKKGYEREKQAARQPSYNVGAISRGHRPVASVRPMQQAGERPTRWIPAEHWQRQGMTAQEMTLPLDVVIPTNQPDKGNIVLKAGQKVLVLKSPKGVYMQLESGKIVAIKTAIKVRGKVEEDAAKAKTAAAAAAVKNNAALSVVPQKRVVKPFNPNLTKLSVKSIKQNVPNLVSRMQTVAKRVQTAKTKPYSVGQEIARAVGSNQVKSETESHPSSSDEERTLGGEKRHFNFAKEGAMYPLENKKCLQSSRNSSSERRDVSTDGEDSVQAPVVLPPTVKPKNVRQSKGGTKGTSSALQRLEQSASTIMAKNKQTFQESLNTITSTYPEDEKLLDAAHSTANQSSQSISSSSEPEVIPVDDAPFSEPESSTVTSSATPIGSDAPKSDIPTTPDYGYNYYGYGHPVYPPPPPQGYPGYPPQPYEMLGYQQYNYGMYPPPQGYPLPQGYPTQGAPYDYQPPPPHPGQVYPGYPPYPPQQYPPPPPPQGMYPPPGAPPPPPPYDYGYGAPPPAAAAPYYPGH